MKSNYRLLFIVVLIVSILWLMFPPVVWAQAAPPSNDPPKLNLTADTVMTVISALLSLFFAYFPGVKTAYENMDSQHKPLVMLIVITAMVWGYLLVASRFQWALIQAGAVETAVLWLACLVANSQTYEKFVRQQKQNAFMQQYTARLDAITPEQQ